MTDHEQLKEIVKDIVYESHKAIADVQSRQYAEISKSVNGHGRILKFLRTDFGTMVAILSIAVSLVAGFYSTQAKLEINSMKLNNLSEQIEEVSTNLTTFRGVQVDVLGRISTIEGFLQNLGLKVKKLP